MGILCVSRHSSVIRPVILGVSLLATCMPIALARPLLIPPKHLVVPQCCEVFEVGEPNISSVAIDGDTVMASAQRSISTSERVNGVYIFQRAADGSWNFQAPLTEGSQFPESVLLNQDIAVVTSNGVSSRIYERGTTGWTQTGNIAFPEHVLRVEDGSVYSARARIFGDEGCLPPYQQWRKVNGAWQVVATIGHERCDRDSVEINNGRALVVIQPNDSSEPQPPAEIYRNVSGSWPLVENIPAPPQNPPFTNWFGPGATQNGSYAYIDIGYLYRNDGADNWPQIGRLVDPEQDLPNSPSRNAPPVLRGNNLLLTARERDFELPSHDIDVTYEWTTLRVYRPAPDGTARYFARLNPDNDIWMSASTEDGKRVVAAGPSNNGGFDPVGKLYVFEIPDSHTFPTRQQDNFQDGNSTGWTPTSGQFSVVRNGVTLVLRQSSLAGDSGAFLTSTDWTDQSIEADLRPLEFAGAGRWLGLVTRRTDAQNYYYVTFRSPNVVSLRRLRNGVVTQLGARGLPDPLVPGRSYRVRLESVGDQHAVFFEGEPMVTAKDSALTHGHPGVAGYRTRFDVDNVLVSGGTRYLMLMDTMEAFFQSGAIQRGTGTWEQINIDEEQDSFHFYMRQTATSGDARIFSRTLIPEQVVSARLRPLAYGTGSGSDPWIGVAARVVDQNNYLYMTLRRSNQLSLRKLVNGNIQVLATVPVNVVTNQWYDLRLEVIGKLIRGFVNGDLKFELNDSSLPATGSSGVLMYKTSADLWSYIFYQP